MEATATASPRPLRTTRPVPLLCRNTHTHRGREVNPIQSSRNRFFFVGGKNLVSISTAACKVFAAVDGRFLLQSQGEKGLEKAVERREFLSIVRGPIVLFLSPRATDLTIHPAFAHPPPRRLFFSCRFALSRKSRIVAVDRSSHLRCPFQCPSRLIPPCF